MRAYGASHKRDGMRAFDRGDGKRGAPRL